MVYCMIFKIATLLNSICIILMLFIISKQYSDMAMLWDMITEIDLMFKDIITRITEGNAGQQI